MQKPWLKGKFAISVGTKAYADGIRPIRTLDRRCTWMTRDLHGANFTSALSMMLYQEVREQNIQKAEVNQ